MRADGRAATLGAIVGALGEEQALTSAEVVAYGHVTAGVAAVLCGPIGDDVLALALECVGLGRELRARQWRALGDFLALYDSPAARSTCDGIAGSVARLGLRDALRLAAAGYVLGWTEQATYEDGESFFRDNDELATEEA